MSNSIDIDSLDKISCKDNDFLENANTANISTFEIEPLMSFSLNVFVGNNLKSEKEYLNPIQDRFDESWINLITPTNERDRNKAITDICKNFSQKEAIEFAGYIGSKNSDIYDHQRVSSSGTDRVRESIPLNDYYQTHRNNEGISISGDRNSMGVCGDSAVMIANFLSKCGFSCDDIDILSYASAKAGHTMVTARGSDGEFFTANWSEVTSENNTNPQNYKTANPRIKNTAAHLNLHDCNGKSKGSTLTPLGTLLMMAHGQDRILNSGQNYSEIKMMGKKWGANEASLKAFTGNDSDSGQSFDRLSAKLNYDLNNKESTVRLNFVSSLVVGRAKKEITRFETEEPTSIKQTIISNRSTLKASTFFESQDLKFEPFAKLDTHQMLSINKTNNPNFETSDNSFDGLVNFEIGTKISYSSNAKIKLDAQSGLRSTFVKNSAQRGGSNTGSTTTKDKITVLPDHLYADAKVFISENNLGLSVKYDNLYLIKRSRLDLDIYKKIKDTDVSVGYKYIKNPSISAIHGLGLGAKQDIQLKNDSITLKGSANYFFVDNPMNQPFVNVGVIYILGQRK